jgi:hypothetical protein
MLTGDPLSHAERCGIALKSQMEIRHYCLHCNSRDSMKLNICAIDAASSCLTGMRSPLHFWKSVLGAPISAFLAKDTH